MSYNSNFLARNSSICPAGAQKSLPCMTCSHELYEVLRPFRSVPKIAVLFFSGTASCPIAPGSIGLIKDHQYCMKFATMQHAAIPYPGQSCKPVRMDECCVHTLIRSVMKGWMVAEQQITFNPS